MFQYVIKRLVLLIVTLFGIALITFGITRLTPGEPFVVIQAAVGSQAMGGYEAVLEQNRRNLGLDKPLFLNFRFSDRESEARDALRDFTRPLTFWQRDAERRARLSSTIALRPALELIARLQETEGPVDHYLEPTESPVQRIDKDDAVRRLVELMPTLAQERPPGLERLNLQEKLEFWETWILENEGRWRPEAVREAVAEYLDGDGELGDVLIRGGYAVPHVMEGLRSEDSAVALRANDALTALTGFSYLSRPENWEEEKREVVSRWESLYQREKIRFSEFSVLGDAVNIFVNTQFGVWVSQLLQFDFGDSYNYRRPVTELLKQRVPVSLILAGLSILFSYVIAIPLGILSAIRRGTKEDKLVTITLFVLYSLPSFWVAQMLLLVLTGGPSPFGTDWPELFPTRGLSSEGYDWRRATPADLVDLFWHLVLPVTALTYGSLAFISRQMRSAMLEVINQDFIRTAYAKGLNPRMVVLKHALRNSLIPILTISAGLLPELFAGAIIIEEIFSIPGMGKLSFEAILNRDYPVINAILFISAGLTLVGILLTDLAYAWVDPRISYD